MYRRRDVPVCTVLYCHGTRWYKVVQGGTRRYMTVQGMVYGGTWRYIMMAVQESVKLYILVCTEHTYSYCSIWFQLDSLLQCCLAEGAVLKTSASNHSNASSSMFQSRNLGLATASASTLPPGKRQWRCRSGGGRCCFRRRRARRRRSGVRVGSGYHDIVVVAVSAGSGVGCW
jgi:hypothetical protein